MSAAPSFSAFLLFIAANLRITLHNSKSFPSFLPASSSSLLPAILIPGVLDVSSPQHHRLSVKEADLLCQPVQIMKHRIIRRRRHTVHISRRIRLPWSQYQQADLAHIISSLPSETYIDNFKSRFTSSLIYELTLIPFSLVYSNNDL